MMILASASPYKRQMMEKTGLPFESVPRTIDEDVDIRDPEQLVRHLSLAKARAVARPGTIVIGIDSIGLFEGVILTRPTLDEARARLRRLSGKEHEAVMGITLIKDDRVVRRVVRSLITFRRLTDEEINRYLETDPNVTRHCLGYDPEGVVSATFIKEVRGSLNTVLSGFPIEVLPDMIRELE